MAAGDRILRLRYAKHPTVEIAGVRMGEVSPSMMHKSDPGGGAVAGPAGHLVTYRGLGVRLMAYQDAAILTAASFGGAVADVVAARVTPGVVASFDPGSADAPGIAGALVHYYTLQVELFGLQYASLLGLVGDDAAELTLTYTDISGTSETVVLSSVAFTDFSQGVELPAGDSGGPIRAMSVTGHQQFAAGEDFSDVLSGDASVFSAVLAKAGATAANLVLGTRSAAGAAEKLTLKNVMFTGVIGSLELRSRDSGGPIPTSFGLQGTCMWGSSDTYTTMLVAAADT